MERCELKKLNAGAAEEQHQLNFSICSCGELGSVGLGRIKNYQVQTSRPFGSRKNDYLMKKVQSL
jgi:hypothetical protein